MQNIINSFKSKKLFYETMEKNRLFGMPGTVQTFYKNGLEYYISINNVRLNDLFKAIDITIGLEKDDLKKHQEIQQYIIKMNNFLLQNAY